MPDTIEDLLEQFGEVMTKDEFLRQRTDLERQFREQYGLTSRAEIDHAVRSHAIPEHALMMDWIELIVFERYIDL